MVGTGNRRDKRSQPRNPEGPMYRTAMMRALVVVCTGILLPVSVSAQGVRTKSAPPRSAEQLEAFAASPKVQASDWIEAARALERAAQLRAPGDPVIVTDLRGAGTAYENAGKLVLARKTVVDGARQALKRGDIYTAANAYVAAARLSLQLQDESRAFTYLDHAKQLATSPRMTPEQIRVIMAQVGRI